MSNPSSLPQAAAAATAWYSIDDLDAYDRPVRLLLHGGEATGMLASDKRTKAGVWKILRDNARYDILPYEPLAWRPLPSPPAEPWPSPLPQPITLAEAGRFVDVRPRKLSAMQRQAEQSAAVQEELRREFGEIMPALPVGATDDQWWLDPLRVTYSEAGSISITEAEGRVCRAILTEVINVVGKKRDDDASAGDSALGSMVASGMSDDEIAAFRKSFKPTPRDHTDHEIASKWFALIAPPELRPKWAKGEWFSGAQKILVWRATIPQWSWRKIARHAGGSQEGWRKTWGGALHCVHRVANGDQPLAHVKVADQLAALQARNREWKRKQHMPVAILEDALGAMGES